MTYPEYITTFISDWKGGPASLWPESYQKIKSLPAKYIQLGHHLCHAANAFYSSGFEEALVVSNDGFGNDGTFCVYEVSKSNPNFDQINEHVMHTYPTKYANCGRFISEIKKKAGPILNNLANAGKVMGLSAYGSFNKDYYKRINNYFLSLIHI